MRFADIPGHEEVKQRLRQMADSGHIPHALMIEGPEGVGKMMLARAFLQYLHCPNRADGDSCGSCPECQAVHQLSYIDMPLCFPVVKKSGGSGCSDDYLPEFRQMVLDKPWMDFEEWLVRLDNINAKPMIYVEDAGVLLQRLNMTARRSRYKTALIWLPERFKDETANKLLKLIEEPADNTIVVMVSSSPQNVLGTIYSRVQRIAVRRYDDPTVAGIIEQCSGCEPRDAEAVARLAAGNVNTALQLVSVSKERKKFLDLFKELMRKAYLRKIVELRQWSTDLAALGREPQMQFYDYCSRLLRENFIYNLQVDPLMCLTADEAAFSTNFARFITNVNVFQLLETFGDARTDIAANGNAKIINFDVAIRVILLLKHD